MFRRSSFLLSIRTLALGLTLGSATSAWAQPPAEEFSGQAPVYQRRSSDWNWHGRGKHDRRFDRRFQRQPPQVNSAWFQRPYPYHLDYYKMRYGGSYAPYFGNLYGPPQVVTAPPYYGPYLNGFEYANPGDGAFGVPFQTGPNGPRLEGPPQPMAPPANDELPAP